MTLVASNFPQGAMRARAESQNTPLTRWFLAGPSVNASGV